MKVVRIESRSNSEIFKRIQRLCDKAKTSGNDAKTTAELLTEIQNIGLKNFINYFDNKLC